MQGAATSEITTSEIMRRFNQAFLEHDPGFSPISSPRLVLTEFIQPAPDGTRYEGYDACLRFWEALAADRVAFFDVEDVFIADDRATIRWRYNFGDGGSVRGVNLMRVRDGRIVEALGYAKSPGQSAPLPR